jgi:hypothetical protein
MLVVDQVIDLAAVSNYLERLPGHDDFLGIEQFPILELVHDLVKHLVKVFVHGRVCVAQLLCLLQQVFAQKVLSFSGLSLLAILASAANFLFLFELLNAVFVK